MRSSDQIPVEADDPTPKHRNSSHDQSLTSTGGGKVKHFFVSIVADARSTETRDVAVQQLFDEIKTGKWMDSIAKIRFEYSRAESEGGDPKKAVAEMKQNLPGVLWCGRFTNRRKPVHEKLVEHSGLLCADLDHVGEKISEVRAKIVASPHLIAVFTSPTGRGLKAVFRVADDAKQHEACFSVIEQHVRELTGIKIDPACKDVARLCFVSHDPDLWINPEGPKEIKAPTPSLIRLSSESCTTASLHTASLHNRADAVLANIKAKSRTLDLLATSRPNLFRLYTALVEPRYHVQPHTRNHFITQAVPFLYRAVASRLVSDLVGCFYDCNRAHFDDPRDEHMNQTKAMLESVIKTYLASLDSYERGIYEALPEDERDTYRICRDLALLESPGHEGGIFFLSFNQLGDRIGVHPPQAQRIMWKLESHGLIRLVKKGTRRALGVRGEAGTYQWLLMPERKR